MVRWTPLGLLLLVACRPPLGDSCGNGADDPGEICLERATILDAGIDPCDLAIADLNGDGINDVVVPNSDPAEGVSEYFTSILLGDAEAPLAIREVVSMGYSIPFRAAVTRGPGQTQARFVVGGESRFGEGSLGVSGTQSDGALTLAGRFGTPNTVSYLATMPDPHGDGELLLTLTSNGLEIHPHAQPEAPPTAIAAIAGGTDVAGCRLRGPDAPPQIVVGTANGRVLVYSIDAAGQLLLDHETDLFGGSQHILALECADLEGEGAQDLLIAAAPAFYGPDRTSPISGRLVQATADGDRVRRVADLEGPGSPFDIAVRDLNDDGLDDYAVTDPYSETVTLWTSTPTGHQALASWATEAWPARVMFGDVDGDGQQDLVVANQRANTVLVIDSNP